MINLNVYTKTETPHSRQHGSKSKQITKLREENSSMKACEILVRI